jgi:serine/threonine protein kinase
MDAYVDDFPSLFGERLELREPRETTPNETTETAAADLLLGTLVDERYEVLSIIGSGGMSVVYVAKDIRLKKIVALKVMLPHLVANPVNLQRFQQEVKAVGNLSHPNVIGVHGFGMSKGSRPYLVMDYCAGNSLANLIAAKGGVEVDRAITIFLEIASALAHAHEKGVIHRDLKPGNILLAQGNNQTDVVKVVDFGIAKILPQKGVEASKLTQTGDIFGSPFYMSPEQCRGEQLDSRSDIYSMGCLMYETLVGLAPLQGENMLEVLYKQISEMPPRFSEIQSKVNLSPKLEAIVFKALAKNPSERYQNMTALRDDLAHYQREHTHGLMDTIAAKLRINWHKRKVWKTSDRVIVILTATAISLAVVSGFTLAMLAVSAAISPYRNVVIGWKENDQLEDALPSRAEIAQGNQSAESALYLSETLLKEISANSEHEVSSEIYELAEDQVKKLNALAASLAKQNLWQQSAKLYVRALALSEAKLKNNQSSLGADESLPVRNMTANLALSYYKSNQYSLAAAYYEKLLKMQQGSRPYILGQTYASLGDCFYFEKKWALSEKAYDQACRAWRRAQDPITDNGYLLSWYLPIKNSLVLITVARLADSCRELGGRETALKAVFLYAFLARSLQVAETPNLQDSAICHFRLAQIGQKLPRQEFVAEISKTQTNNAEVMTVERYFAKAAEEMKQALGERNPVVATMLISYSEYLFSQYDLLKGIPIRLEALYLLSISSHEAKPAT